MASGVDEGPERRAELKRLGLVALLAASVPLAAAGWSQWQDHAVRRALLDELQPVALSNCTLERVGSAHDGGYRMCANLMTGLQVAYSYGVGPNDDWGCAVSRRHRVPVHQYDCFDPARPVCDGGQFIFHDECVSDRASTIDSRAFDSIANQLERNGDTGRRKVVKIDVEGAEWDALLQTPDEVLDRIDQMPMELHGAPEGRMLEVVRKLKRMFHVVNLHFNNNLCNSEADVFPSMAYQVLLVNKRLGILDASSRLPPPSPLNAPDFPNIPDCQIVSPFR